MIKDLYNNVKVENALDATAIATDTDTNGSVIDTQGFQSGVVCLKVTDYTDGAIVGKIQEGDEANGSDMADIPAERVIGGGASLGAANEVDKIGYVSNKQYIRVVVTTTGVTGGLTASAVSVLGNSSKGAVDAHAV